MSYIKNKETSLLFECFHKIISLDPSFIKISKIDIVLEEPSFGFINSSNNRGFIELNGKNIRVDKEPFTTKTCDILTKDNFRQIMKITLPDSIYNDCFIKSYEEVKNSTHYKEWLHNNRGKIAATNLGLI